MRPRSGFERIIAAVPKTDHSSVAADNEKHLAELEFISSMRGCLTDFAAIDILPFLKEGDCYRSG